MSRAGQPRSSHAIVRFSTAFRRRARFAAAAAVVAVAAELVILLDTLDDHRVEPVRHMNLSVCQTTRRLERLHRLDVVGVTAGAGRLRGRIVDAARPLLWRAGAVRLLGRHVLLHGPATMVGRQGSKGPQTNLGTLCYGCSASGSLADGVSSDTLSRAVWL
eukprot:scaffold2190_cov118-Isochrysis_galbana.AAC.7